MNAPSRHRRMCLGTGHSKGLRLCRFTVPRRDHPIEPHTEQAEAESFGRRDFSASTRADTAD